MVKVGDSASGMTRKMIHEAKVARSAAPLTPEPLSEQFLQRPKRELTRRDRTYESRGPSRPLLSQRSRRR